MMDIKYLRLIETVAREGSLSGAERKLFLTQSALSHQLKEIELQMGTDAFHRVNKKISKMMGMYERILRQRISR
jgi:LysR family transcriptional regulator for metE and metH